MKSGKPLERRSPIRKKSAKRSREDRERRVNLEAAYGPKPWGTVTYQTVAQFERRYPHGTFERFTGTEEILGCDCTSCESAYRNRAVARQSFSYYNRPDRKG